jgi:nucleoside-diphosphate-sugar epimerase
MNKSVIIIGATGLIGKEVLNLCLANPNIKLVTILVRKSMNLNHPKLTELVTDFKNLELKFSGDALICCLGTTRNKTPDLDVYKSIDYGITLEVAKIAKQSNISEVHLISAVGANTKSKIFYNRLKGETERDLINLNFESTSIYRPSLLIGQRNEFRLGELIAQKCAPFFDIFLVGQSKKYHSITSKQVATAIFDRLFIPKSKVQILEYLDLIK